MRTRQHLILDILILTIPLCLFALLPFRCSGVSRVAQMETAAPKPRQVEEQRKQIDLNKMVARDLFQVKTIEVPKVETPPPPPPPKKEPVPVQAPQTQLPLELWGVIIDGEQSVAFIYNSRSRENGVYAKGEEVYPGVILIEIHLHKVILDNRGRRQELVERGYQDVLKGLLSRDGIVTADNHSAPSPAPVEAPPANSQYEVVQNGNQVYVTQQEVVRQVKNLNSLLSQVRIRPHIVGGKPTGFKVLHVQPGSFVEAVGIKQGDVLVKINDVVVDTQQRAYEIFNQIQNDTVVEITILRNGTEKNIRYEMR